jgi:hypothetical protein
LRPGHGSANFRSAVTGAAASSSTSRRSTSGREQVRVAAPQGRGVPIVVRRVGARGADGDAYDGGARDARGRNRAEGDPGAGRDAAAGCSGVAAGRREAGRPAGDARGGPAAPAKAASLPPSRVTAAKVTANVAAKASAKVTAKLTAKARPAVKPTGRVAPAKPGRPVPPKGAKPVTRARPAAPARRATLSLTVSRGRMPAPKPGARGRARPVEAPDRTVRLRELDPVARCGTDTSVEALWRVDEALDGRPAGVHLVFFDHHGWYCFHGAAAPPSPTCTVNCAPSGVPFPPRIRAAAPATGRPCSRRAPPGASGAPLRGTVAAPGDRTHRRHPGRPTPDGREQQR